MLFSVLVPVYNAQEYLKRCIDSILEQTWKDFEVVLVNDGSTDASREICDAYAKEYTGLIRVIHQENKGALLTRRTAMQAAKGEYFVIPDADDYIYPHTLAVIAEAIQTHHCDMVLYDFNRVDLYTKETTVIKQLPGIEESVNVITDKSILYHQICTGYTAGNLNAKAFSRDLVDWDVDYTPLGNKICVSNDLFQLFPIVTNAQKILYIQQPLYCYVKTKDSITTKFKPEKYEAYMENYHKREYYMDIWNIEERDKRTARINAFSTISGLITTAYLVSKKTHDRSVFNRFVEKIRNDLYYKEQYAITKNWMTIKNKLLLGSAVRRKRLVKLVAEFVFLLNRHRE